MKKIAIAAALTCAALTMSACATAPTVYNVQNSRTVGASKDVVWERVVEFFAMNNLSIKTIEKDSGIIGAERMIAAPSRNGMIGSWASCGSELLMTPVGQTADLNVFVRPVAAGVTVSVNTRFSESRSFDGPPVSVQCNSTGELERMILDAAEGK